MNTALAFDIWLKATVSICVCVIILTLVAALVQWRRKRGQEEYTVIPPSDTTRRHQGKPKAMLLKGYQASFSGITQPMMKTTIVWSTYGWIWNKQRYFHAVTMSSSWRHTWNGNGPNSVLYHETEVNYRDCFNIKRVFYDHRSYRGEDMTNVCPSYLNDWIFYIGNTLSLHWNMVQISHAADG